MLVLDGSNIKICKRCMFYTNDLNIIYFVSGPHQSGEKGVHIANCTVKNQLIKQILKNMS